MYHWQNFDSKGHFPRLEKPSREPHHHWFPSFCSKFFQTHSHHLEKYSWLENFAKAVLPMTVWLKCAHSHLSKLQSNSSLRNPASYPYWLWFSSINAFNHSWPSKKILSVPETVYIKTFWFKPASSFSSFAGAKTDFEQRKKIICLFHTSLFSKYRRLTFLSAWMEGAIES